MHGPKLCAGFRGEATEASAAAIEVLQAHWPAAFPRSPDLIRPLLGKNELIPVIAERTGWSKRYTTSALAAWKRQPAYAEAVLRHDRWHDLAGEATDKIITESARAAALEHLARIAAVKAEEGVTA
jgi:sRNA-binding protein